MNTTKESVEAERLLNAAIHAESYKDRVDARVKIIAALNERERLRKALSMLVCNSCHNRIGWNETPTKYGDWTKCTSCRDARAALNDQKGE